MSGIRSCQSCAEPPPQLQPAMVPLDFLGNHPQLLTAGVLVTSLASFQMHRFLLQLTLPPYIKFEETQWFPVQCAISMAQIITPHLSFLPAQLNIIIAADYPHKAPSTLLGSTDLLRYQEIFRQKISFQKNGKIFILRIRNIGELGTCGNLVSVTMVACK